MVSVLDCQMLSANALSRDAVSQSSKVHFDPKSLVTLRLVSAEIG